MIGITVTTRNRPEMLDYTLGKLDEFYTDDQIIMVIDDNSECHDRNKEIVEKYGFLYVYNKKRLGIPRTKEQGFKRLLFCDQQFWVDDDLFPKVENWHLHILEAMNHNPHLMYLIPFFIIQKKRDLPYNLAEYNNCAGCFMTFTREMYKHIRGFHDVGWMYGHWHPELSWKLYSLGFSQGKYITLANIDDLLHSVDYKGVPEEMDYIHKGTFTKAQKNIEIQKYEDSIKGKIT